MTSAFEPRKSLARQVDRRPTAVGRKSFAMALNSAFEAASSLATFLHDNNDDEANGNDENHSGRERMNRESSSSTTVGMDDDTCLDKDDDDELACELDYLSNEESSIGRELELAEKEWADSIRSFDEDVGDSKIPERVETNQVMLQQGRDVQLIVEEEENDDTEPSVVVVEETRATKAASDHDDGEDSSPANSTPSYYSGTLSAYLKKAISYFSPSKASSSLWTSSKQIVGTNIMQLSVGPNNTNVVRTRTTMKDLIGPIRMEHVLPALIYTATILYAATQQVDSSLSYPILPEQHLVTLFRVD